jgi:predicted AlkP superfamily phosphohydrolase/phosphomutase
MSFMDRRDFLKLGLGAGSLLAAGSSSDLVARVLGKRESETKMIILGLDGLDAHLLKVWMDMGKLPAFRKLHSMGTFSPLRTSNPPQSPVAWSNFITGMNPGGHGIYDFTHRDPERYFPVFSASLSTEGSKTLAIGNLTLPLSGGKIENLRRGRAFWQILEDYDIPATVFKMPSNYPPVPTKQRTLSGMGTPDIMGSYGIFNYYTTAAAEIREDIGGGRIHEVYVIGNQVEASIPGPINTFKKDRPETKMDFRVYLDPVSPVAKIVFDGEEFILKQGEWSGWKKIRYSLIPTQSASGICQFYLKEVRPEFKLYVSPVNIDPADPILPIATPESYGKELAKKFGSFYTKGLPADWNARDNGILNDEEFLAQDNIVLDERMAMYEYELNRFDSGLLFYYLSSADQRQHEFWRHIDKQNPTYDPTEAKKFGGEIEKIYAKADEIVDMALRKADKDTVIMVLSDHGFAPFRREFNLNTWLKEAGYHSLINPWRQGRDSLFANTDWSKTKAYNIGLNGLYINEKGREAEGIVASGADKENMMREIAAGLEEYVDPVTGEHPIKKAYLAGEIYSGDQMDLAPDIVVGFNMGYRISWASPAGRLPKEIVTDNTEPWSGDHCVDPDVVPGVFLMNRKVNNTSPALYDLTPTVLKIFGIEPPGNMVGRSVL